MEYCVSTLPSMAARGSDDSLLPADDLAGQNAGKQYPGTKNKLKLSSSSSWGKHLSGGGNFTSGANSSFRSIEILGADRKTRRLWSRPQLRQSSNERSVN